MQTAMVIYFMLITISILININTVKKLRFEIIELENRIEILERESE